MFINNKLLIINNLYFFLYLDTLKGHTATVRSIVIDKKNFLYSGSRDKTIKVWNL